MLVITGFFVIGICTAGEKEDKEFTELVDEIELLEQQGRLADAVPLAEKLLGRTRGIKGSDSAYTVLSMGLVAKLYHESGNLSQAELLYKQLLPIYESGFGSDHEIVASTLSSLANLYSEQKRYDEAEPLYARALSLREKNSPPIIPML